MHARTHVSYMLALSIVLLRTASDVVSCLSVSSFLSQLSYLSLSRSCVCVCVCVCVNHSVWVCVRERERERESE